MLPRDPYFEHRMDGNLAGIYIISSLPLSCFHCGCIQDGFSDWNLSHTGTYRIVSPWNSSLHDISGNPLRSSSRLSEADDASDSMYLVIHTQVRIGDDWALYHRRVQRNCHPGKDFTRRGPLYVRS